MQEVADAPALVITPGLTYHAHSRSPRLVGVGGIDPQDPHISRGAALEPAQDIDGRALACAIGSQEREDGAARDGEGGSGQHGLVAVRHGEL